MAQTPDEPLTMTVHSLPQLDQASARSVAATRAGRWKMLLLLLVCASPVVASYFTYYVIRPQGRTNYGELIEPQRTMPALSGVNAQGQSVPLDSLKDQWLLVSVADSACNQRCQQHLYLSTSCARRWDAKKTGSTGSGCAPARPISVRRCAKRPKARWSCGWSAAPSPVGWRRLRAHSSKTICMWSIRWATG